MRIASEIAIRSPGITMNAMRSGRRVTVRVPVSIELLILNCLRSTAGLAENSSYRSGQSAECVKYSFGVGHRSLLRGPAELAQNAQPITRTGEPRTFSRQAPTLEGCSARPRRRHEALQHWHGCRIREEDDIRPFWIYGGVARRRNGVFAAITCSDRERRKGRAVQ